MKDQLKALIAVLLSVLVALGITLGASVSPTIFAMADPDPSDPVAALCFPFDDGYLHLL